MTTPAGRAAEAAGSLADGAEAALVDQAPATSSGRYLTAAEEPWIVVRAGALALHKSGNQRNVLLADANTGQALLTTASTTPGWTAGAEIDFLLRLGADQYFEFDWFTLGNWTRQYGVDLNGAPVNIGLPIEAASISTFAQFRNYEFNLRRVLSDDFTILAGFRYIELNDGFQLYYDASSSGITEDAWVRAFNRLYGFQIGAQGALFRRGPWQLDGWVKSGVFGNSAGNNTDVLLHGANVVLPSIRARKSDAAYVGDLGLRATRQLGEHLQLYGGYRLMFVDGVALGANQYDNISTFYSGTGAAAMVTNGSQLYHGAELGLILAY
ncbi:MAG: hypothetical protein JNG90_14410 [Planctomycetaceae bacterium]|nr:hypothetical protein [Planctomycetaceae bacterium]